MTSQQLYSLLSKTNYKDLKWHSEDSFKWLFETEASSFVSALLNQAADLIITDEEIAKFRELVKSGGSILEGDLLDAALNDVSTLSDDEEDLISESEIEQEIFELEQELHLYENSCNIKKKQCERLERMQKEVSTRQSFLPILKEEVYEKWNRAEQRCKDVNDQMNEMIADLITSVDQLTRLYEEDDQNHNQETEKLPSFLSKLDLQAFHNAEESFGEALKAFTRKQFFDGIADIAREDKDSRYEFLEIRNPLALMIKGEQEAANFSACKDLARMEALYPRSKTKQINALVECQQAKAVKKFAEDKARSLLYHPYPKDLELLGIMLGDTKDVLSSRNESFKHLATQEIPYLIKINGNLQMTHILSGDYDLKIMRQDYFTSNQDYLISCLIQQHARHEFLTYAFEVEERYHRQTRKYLTAMMMTLEELYSSNNERITLMSDVNLSPARYQRATIDTRHKFLYRWNKVFEQYQEHGTEEERPLLLTYNSILEQAKKLKKRKDEALAEEKLSLTRSSEVMEELQSDIKSIACILGIPPSGPDQQPVLTSPALSNSLTQLDSTLKKLEETFINMMKDVQDKRFLLSTNPTEMLKHELFVYFHVDHDKLRRCTATNA